MPSLRPAPNYLQHEAHYAVTMPTPQRSLHPLAILCISVSTHPTSPSSLGILCQHLTKRQQTGSPHCDSGPSVLLPGIFLHFFSARKNLFSPVRVQPSCLREDFPNSPPHQVDPIYSCSLLLIHFACDASIAHTVLYLGEAYFSFYNNGLTTDQAVTVYAFCVLSWLIFILVLMKLILFLTSCYR